jgi:hypothetical protein
MGRHAGVALEEVAANFIVRDPAFEEMDAFIFNA